MTRVQVECDSGHRADQRPVRFHLGQRCLEVAAVQDQWYSPEAMYFRVIAQDGDCYVLKHDEQRDQWTLEAFRAAQPGGLRWASLQPQTGAAFNEWSYPRTAGWPARPWAKGCTWTQKSL